MLRITLYIFLISYISYGTSYSQSLEVEGECKKSTQFDRASLVLKVENLDKKPSVAIKKTKEQYNKLVKKLKALKLKDSKLQTLSFNVYEKKEWRRNKSFSSGSEQVSLGHVAQMSLKVVTSEFDRIGKVIAQANKSKVKDISQFSAFLSKEKYRKVYHSCLPLAVKEAKMKANILAKSAGLKIKSMDRLIESGAQMPTPVYGGARMEMAQAKFASNQALSTPLNVQSGEGVVKASVLMSFKLEK